jgi:bile acid:Na+ symporter, BASS family
VAHVLTGLLKLSLLIFMVGNLLEMGLKVHLRDVGGALRNPRFLGLSLLWSFVLCPAVAYLLTKILPLAEPYAVGLMFLGMAPCAPFLPMVAQKAGGDLAYVAAFMMLTVVGTVVYMPFAVPILVRGFSADPWHIAKPLVFFIAVPLAAGIATRVISEPFAERFHPMVRKMTGIDTLLLLVLILILFGRDFIGAIGTFAIASQILFCAVVTVASYGLGFGLTPAQKSVLALGVCTRNIGAAIAPLFAASRIDQPAISMCALAVPITLVSALIAARRFGRVQ